MPANKNAVIRYVILDEMLSNRQRYYTCAEMCAECNDRLSDNGYDKVSLKTIQNDINDIEEIFGIAIERITIDGRRIVRYEDQTQSIFSKKISNEEKQFLREILNTLGKLSGLENFSYLDDLQKKLNETHSVVPSRQDERQILHFSSNPDYKNQQYLGWFYSAIYNRRVIKLKYRKFTSSKVSNLVVYPYQLRQYNDRWYLICNPVGDNAHPYRPDFLMNLPLDRIEEFTDASGIPYKECPIEDIEERFMDIAGITYIAGREPEEILFCVTPDTAPYIDTKPIHNSQIKLNAARQTECRENYPQFSDHFFYTIRCIVDNYELPRLLSSFGYGLIVLLPYSLREMLYIRITNISAKYDSFFKLI